MTDTSETDSEPTADRTTRPRFNPRLAILYTLGAFVIVLAFAVVLAFVGGGNSGSTTESDGPAPSVKLGADDSSFTATTLPDAGLLTMDGKVTDLPSVVAGRPTMINMFSSSCTPCREEMPDLEALHQAAGSQVQLVGVDLGDSKEVTARFVDQTGVTYRIIRDPNLLLVGRLDITAQPMTIWVDAEGKIVGHRYGALTPTEMRLGVEKHLGIKVPEH